MVFVAPVIKLQQPIRLIPKSTFIKKAEKVLTVTAGIEAGILAGLAGAAPLAVIGTIAGVSTLLGALRIPTIKKQIARTLTGEKGEALGAIIADPSKLLPKEKGIKETAADIAKKAGLLAGTAALVGGGIVAGKKVVEKIKEVKLPKITPSQIAPAALLPSVPALTPITQPLGAVQPTPTPKEIVPVQPITMPSIKIMNKPEINIRFSKSRRFINQQILVR